MNSIHVTKNTTKNEPQILGLGAVYIFILSTCLKHTAHYLNVQLYTKRDNSKFIMPPACLIRTVLITMHSMTTLYKITLLTRK